MYDDTTADEVAFFKRIRLRPYKPVSWPPQIKPNGFHTADIMIHKRKTGKLELRAILEFRYLGNTISEEAALQTGFNIDPDTGNDMVVSSDLATHSPMRIDLQVSLSNVSAALSWNVHFRVESKAKYQIVLGRDFIMGNGYLRDRFS